MYPPTKLRETKRDYFLFIIDEANKSKTNLDYLFQILYLNSKPHVNKRSNKPILVEARDGPEGPKTSSLAFRFMIQKVMGQDPLCFYETNPMFNSLPPMDRMYVCVGLKCSSIHPIPRVSLLDPLAPTLKFGMHQ